MDYNDFSSRLKRTISSLNGRFDEEVAVYVNYSQNENESSFSIISGNDHEETIINKIFIILYNLSSLKDHLKNHLKGKNINPQIIEDEINNSLHLQILIDIVNQEKHGYPLKKSNRSNKNPIIKHAMQMINFTSNSEPGAIAGISYSKNELNVFGDSKMELTAMIFDDKDNFIFMFDELINSCFEKFEHIAKKYNCI